MDINAEKPFMRPLDNRQETAKVIFLTRKHFLFEENIS